jgi:hypothetical protein
VSDDGTETVEVVLNDQQIALVEALCAEHDLGSPAEALRHGLRAFLAGAAQP